VTLPSASETMPSTVPMVTHVPHFFASCRKAWVSFSGWTWAVVSELDILYTNPNSISPKCAFRHGLLRVAQVSPLVFRLGTWGVIFWVGPNRELYTSEKQQDTPGPPLPVSLSWLECSHKGMWVL